MVMTRDRLATELTGQVTSGLLKEGAKLPSERRLAEEYGVSRPVVREALRGLAEQGLIEVFPGRGAYVRQASVSDTARSMGALLRRRQATPRQLTEARRMLECEAAFLATSRATAEDLRAIERALAGFDGAADIIEKVRYDLAFHASIVRAAHNPVIETMFGSMAGMVAELLLRSLGDPSVTRHSLPYHAQILDALRGGDAERARAATAGHLEVARMTYGPDYDRGLTALARRELERLFGAGALLEDVLAMVTPAE
jgi:GntR family transcriptional repressor for pyruvate dehydrogenase complex